MVSACSDSAVGRNGETATPTSEALAEDGAVTDALKRKQETVDLEKAKK